MLAKDFEFQGDWILQTELHQTVLFAAQGKLENPPVAAVLIPHAGKYRVWVAAKDFPLDRPGTRTFEISIAGSRLEKVFGKSGKEGYAFEDGGELDPPVGPALISLEGGKPFARFLGLILTEKLQLTPAKAITPTAYPAAKLYSRRIAL